MQWDAARAHPHPSPPCPHTRPSHPATASRPPLQQLLHPAPRLPRRCEPVCRQALPPHVCHPLQSLCLGRGHAPRARRVLRGLARLLGAHAGLAVGPGVCGGLPGLGGRVVVGAGDGVERALQRPGGGGQWRGEERGRACVQVWFRRDILRPKQLTGQTSSTQLC